MREEIVAQLDAHQGRMEACINAWWKETMACQEVKEPYPEKMEANTEEMRVQVRAAGSP
jgi:hypothetical protein